MANLPSLSPQLVLDHKCLLGEGPVWDFKKKIICWIDILRGEIHQYSPEKKNHFVIPVNQVIGCIALCNDGGFIAARKNGFAFISRDGKIIEEINDPESHLPGNRFNDGKCDPTGRFWAGTMSLAEENGAGSLYTIDTALKVTKKLGGSTISNGLAWTSDKKILYYIDTPTSQIFSFDYDDASGNITNRKSIIKIAAEDGFPDGMTIDSEGMVWVAHWDGWQVSRWNPLTGEKLLRVAMPVARVTSCTFGGDALQDLYITTASKELTEEQLKQQPLAGSLFVLENCSVKGLPTVEFIR